MKPADLVPGCAWALAEIISRSGIPAGVFNLVMGRGSVIGDPLVNHPGVDAISFTGSQGVGAQSTQVKPIRTSSTMFLSHVFGEIGVSGEIGVRVKLS